MALPSTPTGRVLLGARTALGISTLLAPRLAGTVFFLDPDDNPQLPVSAAGGAFATCPLPPAALLATTLGALAVAGESEQTG